MSSSNTNSQGFYDFPSDSAISVDPVTLDSVHFEYGPQEFYANEGDPRTEELEKLRSLVRKLSKYDRELYKAYYTDGKTQEAIAKSLGVSQYAVCVALKTLQKRLTVYANLPYVKWSNIYRLLKAKQGPDGPLEITLKCFFENYSQLTTAKVLTSRGFPCTQSTVRNRLNRILGILESRGHKGPHQHLSILMSSGKILHNRRTN